MPKIEPGIVEETLTDEDLEQLDAEEYEEEKHITHKRSKSIPVSLPNPILYEIKPLLEQLVQKQNFWTKGKDVRNDGPRIWDLLQRLAKDLNLPIPDHVKAKIQVLGGKV